MKSKKGESGTTPAKPSPKKALSDVECECPYCWLAEVEAILAKARGETDAG